MPKTIHIVDPQTREYLGTAEAPLDPVASARAGKPMYAEVNSANATDQAPPEHDKHADDVRWQGDKHGWQVDKGAKAKRQQAEAAAAKEAAAKQQAEQLEKQLAAMTDSERKLHALRAEDPAAFDADELEANLQEREAKAQARLERHEKRREKRREERKEKNRAEQAEKDAAKDVAKEAEAAKAKPETANNNPAKK